jgi:hypothetical protein
MVTVVASEAGTNDTLYYTVDGTLPTTNSTLYTGPILVTNSETISVNAWAPGYVNSIVSTAQFTILPGAHFASGIGFTNGTFAMSFVGAVGPSYVLQTSTNLVDWISIGTNTPGVSTFILIDPTPSGAERFYRALQWP